MQWIVIDASPINVLDATGLGKIGELSAELRQQGVALCWRAPGQHLQRFFNPDYAKAIRESLRPATFDSIKQAVNAFTQQRCVPGLVPEDADSSERPEISGNWRDAA